MQVTENQRLKIFRKSLNLNQKDFGESLGLTQGGYSDIERGKNGVSNRIKIFLHQIHSLNIHWLETGEGEMLSATIDELGKNFISLRKDGNFNQEEKEKLLLEIEKQKSENFKLNAELELYKDLCSSKGQIIAVLEEQVAMMKRLLEK